MVLIVFSFYYIYQNICGGLVCYDAGDGGQLAIGHNDGDGDGICDCDDDIHNYEYSVRHGIE